MAATTPVRQVGVMVSAGVAGRVGVDGRAGQPRHGVGELVFGVGGDLVGGDDAQIAVDDQVGLRV